MTGYDANTQNPRPAVTTHPLLGVAGVLLGALIATCTARLMSVGLADIRGALHLRVDEGSWINTAFNASMMFIGPFSVYPGGLLGPRRVLLACAWVFTVVSFLIPFCHSLEMVIALLVIAGLSAGTFYSLTLSFVLRNLPMRFVLVGIAMYATDIIFTTDAMGRAAEVLALQVRQQACTLAISDSFLLLATCCLACLVVVSFMFKVATQYRQVTAAPVEAP